MDNNKRRGEEASDAETRTNKKRVRLSIPDGVMETEEEEKELQEHQSQLIRPMEEDTNDDDQRRMRLLPLSIQRNNEAITAFLQGRLVDAHRLFMEASILQHMAFHDERNGSREYRCKWVNIDSTALGRLNPSSSSQNVHMSHVSMLFLRICEEEEEEMSENNNMDEMQPRSSVMAPDVILENLYWAADFNLALTSQLLGILFPNTDSQGMHFRALSFGTYEQLEADIVDWYDVDGFFAPLPIAILVMAIYNNQGAMFCQLKVRNQVEAYWDRMKKIWNRASHRFLGICNLFQRNLEYLEATDTQIASAA